MFIWSDFAFAGCEHSISIYQCHAALYFVLCLIDLDLIHQRRTEEFAETSFTVIICSTKLSSSSFISTHHEIHTSHNSGILFGFKSHYDLYYSSSHSICFHISNKPERSINFMIYRWKSIRVHSRYGEGKNQFTQQKRIRHFFTPFLESSSTFQAERLCGTIYVF